MYRICPIGETRRRCQIYDFRAHIPAHAFHAAAPQTLHKKRLRYDQKSNLGVVFTLFITLQPPLDISHPSWTPPQPPLSAIL